MNRPKLPLCVPFSSERSECSSETDNRGTTTFRTKIYIYTLSCQGDVVPLRGITRGQEIVNRVFASLLFFFSSPPNTNHTTTLLLCFLKSAAKSSLTICKNAFLMTTADSTPQNVFISTKSQQTLSLHFLTITLL